MNDDDYDRTLDDTDTLIETHAPTSPAPTTPAPMTELPTTPVPTTLPPEEEPVGPTGSTPWGRLVVWNDRAIASQAPESFDVVVATPMDLAPDLSEATELATHLLPVGGILALFLRGRDFEEYAWRHWEYVARREFCRIVTFVPDRPPTRNPHTFHVHSLLKDTTFCWCCDEVLARHSALVDDTHLGSGGLTDWIDGMRALGLDVCLDPRAVNAYFRAEASPIGRGPSA